MKLKIIISIVAIILAILHLVFPAISIDATTLVLFVVALMPWVMPLVKSVELPGGFKIELQDVKAATDKVVGVAAGISRGASTAIASGEALTANQKIVDQLQKIAMSDSNLAVVGTGIEIEKRLLRLAEDRGLKSPRSSAVQLLAELEKAQIIEPAIAMGLRDLLSIRNRAAHGAVVSQEAAAWVLNVLPSVLQALDRLPKKPK